MKVRIEARTIGQLINADVANVSWRPERSASHPSATPVPPPGPGKDLFALWVTFVLDDCPELVFISYCLQDREWLERLQVHLKPRGLKSWDNTKLRAGEERSRRLDMALAQARVAVLLVSPDFLAADSLLDQELLPLLARAAKGCLTVIWVPVRPSAYAVTVLSDYQASHSPDQPLSGLSETAREVALERICDQIVSATSCGR